jgi:RHS repeat-associated protein
VIVDPATGNSLQRVDGGFAGGIEVECVRRAFSLDALIRAKLLKHAREHLQTAPISDEQRAVALAALIKLYAEANSDPVALPSVLSVVLSVSVGQSVGEVSLWLHGVLDASEKLTPQELAELGITALENVPCSQPPPCGSEGDGPGDFGVGSPAVGNPVAVGTGAKWQSENDFQGSGAFPLSFTRTYLSAAARTDNWIGAKWTASYFQSVRLPPAANGGLFPISQRPKSVLLQRPGGSWLQFNWRGTAYVTDANLPGHLERLTQGGNTSGWVYTNTADLKELYDANGRLLSISNRAGLAHTLTYDPQFRPTRVTDSFGRTLKFEYDPTTGYLASFRDPLDQPYEFEHDEHGNLVLARYPSGYTRRYQFEDLNQRYQLTSVIDERGISVSTWKYDHQGRVKAHALNGGVGTYTFNYEKDKTTVVDPLGVQRDYEYQRIFERPYLSKISKICASCGGQNAEIQYDTRGLISERRDFRGAVTRYTRDDRGMVTQMIEAFGTPEARTTTTIWHPQWYLPTQIVAPSATGTQTTTLAYDAEGNLERRTVNAGGQIREWTSTYNGDGQVLTMDGPRTDVIDVSRYTYDADGNRESATDAAGHITEFLDHDAAGRLLKMRDSNDVVTEMSYHPRGWLLTRTIRANVDGSPSQTDSATRLEYEPTGDVKRMLQADGVTLEYCRDGVRRITAAVYSVAAATSQCSGPVPAAGTEYIAYQLDANGNRIREEVHDTNGELKRVLARQYNELGQLRSQINAPFALAPDLDDGSVLKTRYTYDGNGNQVTMTDALGRIVENEYDPLNRLKQAVRDIADGDPVTINVAATVQYIYDAVDNLRLVIDPNLLVTAYAYDGLNNLKRLDSPDTGSTTYDYDDSGNRTLQVDARGVQTIYRYDALNRLTIIEYPGEPAKTVQVRYDQDHGECDTDERHGQTRLTELADASGSTKYCYDRQGNLTRKLQVTQGRTLAVRYRYNAANRMMGTIYPSGLNLSITRDTLGRIKTAGVNFQGTGVPIVNEMTHLPFGPVQTVAFDNGQSLTKSWDLNYWPDAVTSPAFNYDFTTNPVGNIVSIGSSSDPAREYVYDRLDHLAEIRRSNQTLIESYVYDASGNRVQRVANSVTEALTYENTPPTPVLPGSPTYRQYSHRLQSVGSAPRTYDEVGNTLSGIPSLTVANAQAEYDVRNRLTGIRLSSGNYISQYVYNGQGERVTKWVGSIAEFYAYDESGQLLGQYRSSASQGTEWTLDEELIWLDNQLVANVRIESGQLLVSAILTDHLNTPRAIVTLHGGIAPAGTTVWKWPLTAKDNNSSNEFGSDAPSEDPDGNGIPLAFGLRFPGQQYDVETGLNYNYLRDYEPGVGRYMESDPVGLRGGIATYSYVGATPLRAVDPSGREMPGCWTYGNCAPSKPPRFPALCCRPIDHWAGTYFNARHCVLIDEQGIGYELLPNEGFTIGYPQAPNDKLGKLVLKPNYSCAKCTPKCSTGAGTCFKNTSAAYPVGNYYGEEGPNSNSFASSLFEKCCQDSGSKPSGLGWTPGWGVDPPIADPPSP